MARRIIINTTEKGVIKAIYSKESEWERYSQSKDNTKFVGLRHKDESVVTNLIAEFGDYEEYDFKDFIEGGINGKVPKSNAELFNQLEALL